MVAFRRRARSMTSGPATTSVSLFARATVLPASRAAQVPSSPAAPTIAVRTRSVDGSVTIRAIPSRPESISTPDPRSCAVHLGLGRGVGHGDEPGFEGEGLLDQLAPAGMGAQAEGPEPGAAVMLDHARARSGPPSRSSPGSRRSVARPAASVGRPPRHRRSPHRRAYSKRSCRSGGRGVGPGCAGKFDGFPVLTDSRVRNCGLQFASDPWARSTRGIYSTRPIPRRKRQTRSSNFPNKTGQLSEAPLSQSQPVRRGASQTEPIPTAVPETQTQSHGRWSTPQKDRPTSSIQTQSRRERRLPLEPKLSRSPLPTQTRSRETTRRCVMNSKPKVECSPIAIRPPSIRGASRRGNPS